MAQRIAIFGNHSTTCRPPRNRATSVTCLAAKKPPASSPPQLLSRVEELKLLSQVEKSGLLSTLEDNGLTLKRIEQLGLLSKAESLGLLSAASEKGTTRLLFFASSLALAGGAATVYFVPDDTPANIALQLLGAGALVGGAVAAYLAGNLLTALQK